MTRRTDALGDLNAPDPEGVFDRIIRPGIYVVVTDIATGTMKTLVVDSVAVKDVDFDADTSSGIATAGRRVDVWPVDSLGAQLLPPVSTVATSESRWQVDFGALGFDLRSSMGVSVASFDADGDRTSWVPAPGCDTGAICAVYADTTNDIVGTDAMSPDSDVRIEVFESKGGPRIFGPVRQRTGDSGGTEVELAFDHDIDLMPGNFVVAKDLASDRTKRLELGSLSITSVDPDNDAIEGTGPPGSVVDVRGVGGSRNVPPLQAGLDGRWTFDFQTIGYDVTDVDAFGASLSDPDRDYQKTFRGSPVPDCIPDAATVCGTAGPEALRTESDAATAQPGAELGASAKAAARRWQLKAGGRSDTSIAVVRRATRSVNVDTGTGTLDRVVVIARRRAGGTVRIHGRSDRLQVVLPAHAWRISASVSGTSGRDRVGTRRFGGRGAASGSYRIIGKGGSDALTGGDANDRITGGDGRDVLKGKRGRDTLLGGPGRDTCHVGKRDSFKSCEILK